MNRHRQRLKYLLSDFVTAAIVWCLMNILRYYEVARYDGFHSLGQFLTFHQVIIMQFFIPLFWLALYYLSGYYNRPFGKSSPSSSTTCLVLLKSITRYSSRSVRYSSFSPTRAVI